MSALGEGVTFRISSETSLEGHRLAFFHALDILADFSVIQVAKDFETHRSEKN